MSRSVFNLRKRPRISYYELPEPSLDEYIFCTECGDYVFEYCSIHGPLLVIPDDKVPAKHSVPAMVPRAALTIPHVFLHLARSTIPGAGIGVFTTLKLPRGVRFGPYGGQRTNVVNSMYCWQIYGNDSRASHVIDAGDPARSNWMRYVNCSRHWCEQNLIAYQYQGQIYYRTTRIIPRFTELMVFYGSEFANKLGVDLKRYNAPASFAGKLGTNTTKLKKSIPVEDKSDAAAAKQEKLKASKRRTGTKTESKKSLDNSSKATVKECMKDEKKPKDLTDKRATNDNTKLNPKYKAKCNESNFINSNSEKVNSVDKVNLKNSSSVNSTFVKTSEIVKPVEIDKPNNYILPVVDTIIGMAESVSSVENHNNIGIPDKNNTNTTLSSNSFLCVLCPFETYCEKYLEKHLRAHAANISFNCEKCHYKTVKSNHLAIHKKIHSGEKPYSCTVCSKTFARQSHLRRHLRIHSGEKPYSCAVCSKTFNQQSNLRKHLRIHSGEKPYSCTVCSKTFNIQSNLRTHLRIHSGEKPYSCTVCSKTFNIQSNLRRHLRIHSGEKPYVCDICKANFRHKTTLKKHLFKHS